MTQALKILVIQTRQFGDVLLSTPLLKAIQEALPSSCIHFYTEPLGAQALTENPHIHSLHVLSSKASLFEKINFFRKLKKEKFNCVLDLISTPKTGLLCFYLGSKWRLGNRNRYMGLCYTHIINEKENVYHYAVYGKILFLEKLLKITGQNHLLKKSLLNYSEQTEIFLTKSELTEAENFCKQYEISKKNTIAMNVVSRKSYKIWASENYVKIVEHLLNCEQRILFLYGPNEKNLVENVLNLLPENLKKHKNIIINYHSMKFKIFYGILNHCKIYIGNDGGPKHLAIAAGLQTFTIFQNIFPGNWTPVFDKKHKAFESNQITPEEVINQIGNL